MARHTDSDDCELLLSCRYGDLEDIQQFVKHFGQDALAQVLDDHGNSVLHMAAGNGHEDVLDYLLPIVPPSLLSTKNASGSTPLHWAALNSHLTIMQKLVQFSGGPGVDLIDIKNEAGRSPLTEAEMVGWDEGAKWLVERMKLDPEQEDGGSAEEENISERDIQVEIEDAEGRVAKMTVAGCQSSNKVPSS